MVAELGRHGLEAWIDLAPDRSVLAVALDYGQRQQTHLRNSRTENEHQKNHSSTTQQMTEE